MLGTTLKTSAHRRVVELLNELHMLRHVAAVCDLPHVYGDLQGVLAAYEREGAAHAQGHQGEGQEGEEGLQKEGDKEKESSVDEFGRAYGMGRRKDASARVWIIPSSAGRSIGTASATTATADDTTAETSFKPEQASSEILINHLPLSAQFARSSDADIILRPLRLTGLLGAYNIFALTRGGGTSGQAGAVALALSRALVAHRPETKDVLFRDGALMRDTRMVERKKTGKAKARKKVSLFPSFPF